MPRPMLVSLAIPNTRSHATLVRRTTWSRLQERSRLLGNATTRLSCETLCRTSDLILSWTILNRADSKRLTCKDCEVLFHVNKQSLDFASGVHVDTADFDIDEDGQDIMFGYAGDETENVALLTSSMSTHVGKKLSVVAPRTAAQHRSIQSPQQRNLNKPEQQTEQAMQERERRQREEGEKGRKREKGKKG